MLFITSWNLSRIFRHLLYRYYIYKNVVNWSIWSFSLVVLFVFIRTLSKALRKLGFDLACLLKAVRKWLQSFKGMSCIMIRNVKIEKKWRQRMICLQSFNNFCLSCQLRHANLQINMNNRCYEWIEIHDCHHLHLVGHRGKTILMFIQGVSLILWLKPVITENQSKWTITPQSKVKMVNNIFYFILNIYEYIISMYVMYMNTYIWPIS